MAKKEKSLESEWLGVDRDRGPGQVSICYGWDDETPASAKW